jgi:hypothetical protein
MARTESLLSKKMRKSLWAPPIAKPKPALCSLQAHGGLHFIPKIGFLRMRMTEPMDPEKTAPTSTTDMRRTPWQFATISFGRPAPWALMAFWSISFECQIIPSMVVFWGALSGEDDDMIFGPFFCFLARERRGQFRRDPKWSFLQWSMWM